MRGPKRASKIRKLFNLEKADDVRKYVNTYRRKFQDKVRAAFSGEAPALISCFSALPAVLVSSQCTGLLELGTALRGSPRALGKRSASWLTFFATLSSPSAEREDPQQGAEDPAPRHPAHPPA